MNLLLCATLLVEIFTEKLSFKDLLAVPLQTLQRLHKLTVHMSEKDAIATSYSSYELHCQSSTESVHLGGWRVVDHKTITKLKATKLNHKATR